jgi:hypothetical protein
VLPCLQQVSVDADEQFFCSWEFSMPAIYLVAAGFKYVDEVMYKS